MNNWHDMRHWEAFIIALFSIVIILSLYHVGNVYEVRRYMEQFSEISHTSSDFPYVKDFMDRNVRVFVLLTTIMVTIISIGVGLVFRTVHKADINSIRKEVRIIDESVKENMHKQQNNYNALLSNTSLSFLTTASVLEEIGFTSSSMFVNLHSLALSIKSGVFEDASKIALLNKVIDQSSEIKMLSKEAKKKVTDTIDKILQFKKCTKPIRRGLINLYANIENTPEE